MIRKLWSYLSLVGLLFTVTACQAASPTNTPIPLIETEEQPAEPTPTVPEPQASHTPTMAPTATPQPSPTPRTILRQDDFSDASSGWERYQEMDGILDYVADEEAYQMNVLVEDALWYVWQEDDLANVTFSVEVWQVEGSEEALYGLLCRFDPTAREGLVFLINSQGQAGVGLMENKFQPLPGGELTQFDALRTGLNARNTIEAGCMGDTLSMTVNGETLFTLPAVGLGGGDIGLVVRTAIGSGADVRFDNLILYAP